MIYTLHVYILATPNLFFTLLLLCPVQNQEEEEAMTASAASEAASGLSMSWEEFVAFYLPQCTSDFYASQGWVPNKELHLDQMVMVEAFQQEVFHMVNCALLNPE